MQQDQTGFQLFYHQCLHDLKCGEKRVVQCATALSLVAYTEQLQQQLLLQANTAENHIRRLDRIFQLLETPKLDGKCQVIELLTEKAGKLVKCMAIGTSMRDAAIIYAVQLISHYKIVTYSNLIGILEIRGTKEAVDLLKLNLKEERQCEDQFTMLANEWVHPAINKESSWL